MISGLVLNSPSFVLDSSQILFVHNAEVKIDKDQMSDRKQTQLSPSNYNIDVMSDQMSLHSFPRCATLT